MRGRSDASVSGRFLFSILVVFMNIKNGFLVKTEADALREIKDSCPVGDIRRINFPLVSSLMTYYISDNGLVWGCRKHHGFYLVTPLIIGTRYKKGPVFKMTLGHKKQVEIYLAVALYNTFRMDYYDEHLELEYVDGNPYNISLSNLRKKVPKIPRTFIANMNFYSSLYNQCFDKAVHMVLWFGGINMRLDEAKDVASDAFFEMCLGNVNPDTAINLWLHICKYRASDRSRFMGRFRSILNEYGEEYLGFNPEYIDTGMWEHVKGARRREYLKWWCAGETPSAVAEITHSTLSSVGSSITRSIQHLQKVYNNDIIIWKRTDRKY